MWNYNQTQQTELYHHGVKGMKWGVRKAQYKERMALRRASGAIGDKRKEEFLKVADKHRQTADNYKQQINKNKADKRGNSDAANLSKNFEKHLDALNNSERSTKKIYYVDENGNNSYDKNGKPIFDRNRGIEIIDTKKSAKTRETRDAYHRIKEKMSKKYDDVVSKAEYDIETGKASIKVQLTKHGKTYVSEITKDYGKWTQQVDFVTYKK